MLTIPVGSLQVYFSTGEVDSLRGIARARAEEVLRRWVNLAPDQGFAWLTLPSGESVGIIDVPGHKDFIKNMKARGMQVARSTDFMA